MHETMTASTGADRTAGALLRVAPTPASPPPGFIHDVYERTWTIDRRRSDVWAWLCDPATFTDGQIPPFRVEFLQNPAGENGFAEGVYNQHVGPLMCFAGVLGEFDHERYRDLQYFYGSYAVSHALYRPTRLQFWLDDGDRPDSTTLTLQLDTFVRANPLAVGTWNTLMDAFWTRFGHWAERAIPNNWLR